MKAQMHDFMDGNGPVPSHIHTKGGGWVRSEERRVGKEC